MKKLTITICALATLTCGAFAGTSTYSSGKEMKQTAAATAPCAEFYRTREWNVSLWGTYAFTGEDWRNDRYLGVDHAFGGGISAKYFFAKYFGLGVEGYGLSLNENHGTFFNVQGNTNGSGAAGAVLGTFTFRYPIPCTRFAPYGYVGGGGIFGGGGRTFFTTEGAEVRDDSRSELIGQFGGGFEVRFTPHIGLINDFSWNVVNGSKNNFGMARTGLNFAF